MCFMIVLDIFIAIFSPAHHYKMIFCICIVYGHLFTIHKLGLPLIASKKVKNYLQLLGSPLPGTVFPIEHTTAARNL